MKKMERILIATDFSPSAQAATEVAVSLAKKFGSTLTCLHIIIPAPHSSPSEGALKRNAREQFKALEERLALEGVNIDESITVLGKPFAEILKTAEHNNFNLIIMGACGEKSTAERLVLGSTAEKVIRKSEKPVLAVKPPATDIFEHILAAVDFSDVSERALKNAIRLTRAFESHLMVLHVIDDIEECLLYLDVEEEKQDVQLQWREQCSTAFDKLLKKTDFYDLPWEKIVRTGKPHEEIQTAAKEIHADLIVMGASGHSRLREILMGTTASKVSRALPCSLLTVKEEDVLLVTSELVEDIEDIETLYKEGLELLKGGFLEEAIGAFEHLLKHDMHFAPGWDAMAEAYKRLKQPFKAETCREHAEMIRQRLWAQKSDINSQ